MICLLPDRKMTGQNPTLAKLDFHRGNHSIDKRYPRCQESVFGSPSKKSETRNPPSAHPNFGFQVQSGFPIRLTFWRIVRPSYPRHNEFVTRAGTSDGGGVPLDRSCLSRDSEGLGVEAGALLSLCGHRGHSGGSRARFFSMILSEYFAK